MAFYFLNSERQEALWVVLTADGVAVVATGVVVGTLKDHVAQLTTTRHLA